MGTLNPKFGAIDDSPLEGFVGNSPVMKDAYQLARIAANSRSSVLLLGETGTGKNLVAAAIHRLSPRADGPFVRINCAALTEQMLDRELFGVVNESDRWSKNAVSHGTDSLRVSTGRLESARGGSIFLDEVNAMPLNVQVKLIGVLQDREFQISGSSESVPVDVRVIAASNQDLNLEVKEARFREDLYWRLNVIPIALPPLRRRVGDVALLVQHFLRTYAAENEKQIEQIHPDAEQALDEYQWPGNVRELQTYIERAVVLTEGNQLEANRLPVAVLGDSQAAQVAVFRPTDDQSLIREFVYSRISKSETDSENLYSQIVEPVEKELIEQVLQLCNHTQTKAANKLGINRNTLYKKLVEFGLAKSKTGESEG